MGDRPAAWVVIITSRSVSNAETADPGAVAHTNCLFEQPWWLEAVAPGSWGVAVAERRNEIVARMPYVVESRAGLRLVRNPPMTQTLGPWVRLPEGKYHTVLADYHELVLELLEQLPKCDLFAQTFPAAVKNALPFHWNGYTHTTRYTYQIQFLQSLRDVWNGFSENCRRVIRKAEKAGITVSECPDVSELYTVICKTWHRQQLRPPVDFELLRRVHDASRARNSGRVFLARDGSGMVLASMLLVWDSRSAYYLASGVDPDHRRSGAQNLLLWHAIQFAAGVTQVFDFEGSMNRSIGHFFRSFGAHPVQLLHVRKLGRRMLFASALKDLLQATIGEPVKWFF